MIVVNLLLCSVGGWVCICRMGMMTLPKMAVRSQYVILFMLFAASGISWIYGESPTIVQVAMGAAILAHLLLGWGAWRHGAPRYTMREIP